MTIYALFLCHLLVGGQMSCQPVGGSMSGPYQTVEACEQMKARLPPPSAIGFTPAEKAELVCMQKTSPTWEPAR
jgi:hypothetical protein